MKIKRGDNIIADLGQHETSIQSGIRPCVVMSNDMANKHSLVITVVPLTSKIHQRCRINLAINLANIACNP